MSNKPKSRKSPGSAHTPQIVVQRKPQAVLPPSGREESGFSKWFRHYLNGKVYYAADYGHRAWPIGKHQ